MIIPTNLYIKFDFSAPFHNKVDHVDQKIDKNVSTYSKVRNQPKVNATGANNVQSVEELASCKHFLDLPNLSKIL